MKNLILLSLLLVSVACSKGSGKGSQLLIPEISTPEVQLDLEVVNDDEANDESNDENDDTVVLVPDLENPIASEAESCELVSLNERQEVYVKFQENKVKLAPVDAQSLVVEGFIFNPSMNQNAALQHQDENFTYRDKRVIKITGRVVFDKQTKLGELQVAFRLKESKGSSQTDFMVLAEIRDCK